MSAQFDLAYVTYAASQHLALTGRRGREAAGLVEESFDQAWNETSRALAPMAALGRVLLLPAAAAASLHTIARQMVWSDEAGLPLAVVPYGCGCCAWWP